MLRDLKLSIVGATPLLLSNDQAADPLNTYCKQISEIKKKRKKTDDDHLRVEELEWYSSLYIGNDEVCVPEENLEALLIEAAKNSRQGKAAKAAIMVDGGRKDGMVKLSHKGPSDIEKLRLDKNFRRVWLQPTKIGGRVRTCRPMFAQWGLSFTVKYEDGALDAGTIKSILVYGGQMVGLGASRPKFGRFTVA